MRIMVIHPGHSHSTADVHTGLCAGLTACGADVIAYPLDHVLNVNQRARALMDEHAPELAPAFDAHAVSAHAVIGRAIWREVDCVIAVTGQNLHFGAVGTLKKAGILTALICTESPYTTLERERWDAAHYDVVFTNDKAAVGMFDKPAVYLPAAYNPAVHTLDGPRAPSPPDAIFIGSGFPERQALFNSVDWTGIDMRLHGALWGGPLDLMDNTDAACYYRATPININHHRTVRDWDGGQHIAVGAAYSLGPRAYEIAACGGFQLMDDSRAEAHEVFGGSLVTYHDADDLGRQVRYYLAHPEERARIARAQHAAVSTHTWTARAGVVLDTLQEHTCLRLLSTA